MTLTGCTDDAMNAMPPLPLRKVPTAAVERGCTLTPLGVPAGWLDSVQNNVLDVVDRIDHAINGRDEELSSDDDGDDATLVSGEEEELMDIHRGGAGRSRNSRRYRHRGGDGESNSAGNEPSHRNRVREYRHRKRRERRRHRRGRRDRRRGRSSSPGRVMGDADAVDEGIAQSDSRGDDPRRAYQVRFSPGTIVDEPEGECSGTSGRDDGRVDMDQNNLVDGTAPVDIADDDDSFDQVHQLTGASTPNVPYYSDVPTMEPAAGSTSMQHQQQQHQGGEGDDNSIKTDLSSKYSLLGAGGGLLSGAGGGTTRRIDRLSRSLTHRKRSFRLGREWSANERGH